MKVDKTHELDVEVEITEDDVSDFLLRRAYDKLSENDPLVEPAVSGPHVFQADDSRWYWGKSKEAVQYIRAAHMLNGWGDPQMHVSNWAYIDDEKRILLRRPSREQLLEDRDAYPDADIAALDTCGVPIINDQ